MAKYQYNSYEYGPGDRRTMVEAFETVYIAYIVMGGSGCNITSINAGQVWHEGPDEIIGVYDSYEEADNAVREYIHGL